MPTYVVIVLQPSFRGYMNLAGLPNVGKTWWAPWLHQTNLTYYLLDDRRQNVYLVNDPKREAERGKQPSVASKLTLGCVEYDEVVREQIRFVPFDSHRLL